MRPINTILRTCSLFLVSLTCSCSHLPGHIRHALIGQTRADIVSCIGVPDQEEVRDGQNVLTWKQERASPTAFSITTPFSTALSFSATGACHVTATVREGRVVRVAYSGPSGGIEGRDSACAAVVRGCVRDDSGKRRIAE